MKDSRIEEIDVIPGFKLAVIPEDTLRDICQLGKGAATCRYIVMDQRGYQCSKRAFWISNTIDKRAALMEAKRDNCEGLYLVESEPQPQ